VYAAFGYLHAQLIHARLRAGALVRGQRGQGTVEYVALILLVALVMFGAVSAMKVYKFSGGQELGDLILKKIKEAVSKVRY